MTVAITRFSNTPAKNPPFAVFVVSIFILLLVVRNWGAVHAAAIKTRG